MHRRKFLGGLTTVSLVFGVPAFGQTSKDRIIRDLTREGYREIRISRTLLGRLRFVATGPKGRREIVINPATGDVLRDYLDRRFATDGQKPGSGPSKRASSGEGDDPSGHDGDDADDEADDEPDDDEGPDDDGSDDDGPDDEPDDDDDDDEDDDEDDNDSDDDDADDDDD